MRYQLGNAVLLRHQLGVHVRAKLPLILICEGMPNLQWACLHLQHLGYREYRIGLGWQEIEHVPALGVTQQPAI